MPPLSPPDADPNAWEQAVDPSGAFTCTVPRGWQVTLTAFRNGAQAMEVIAVASGGTRMFVGDPAIPMYTAAPAFPTPGIVPRPYTSIEHALPQYAHETFARLPGYRPVGIRPEPALIAYQQQRVAATGLPGGVTAARLRFDHAGGATVLLGAAVALGPIWNLDVAGVTTDDGDPDAWVPALMALLTSRRTTPAAQRQFAAERAASAAQHQATMASIHQHTAWMQQSHAQRMADLHANAAAHQSRMHDLQSTFDAANAAWSARQAEPSPAAGGGGDSGHRAFVDAITGQHDVVGPDGDLRRVDDGFDRYFRNRHDGTWVGLRAHQDLADALRGTGVDPGLYDEFKRR